MPSRWRLTVCITHRSQKQPNQSCRMVESVVLRHACSWVKMLTNVYRSNRLCCHAESQEVRCHTRGEFEESTARKQRSMQVRDHWKYKNRRISGPTKQRVKTKKRTQNITVERKVISFNFTLILIFRRSWPFKWALVEYKYWKWNFLAVVVKKLKLKQTDRLDHLSTYRGRKKGKLVWFEGQMACSYREVREIKIELLNGERYARRNDWDGRDLFFFLQIYGWRRQREVSFAYCTLRACVVCMCTDHSSTLLC